ncbi:ATP synthase subunit d, mitochondrial-like [Chelonus insularis]|uniref:ATP synthase subunit d, mitochondrial-like n=1 Tax=Chelonus insularis TaxID=460826 RepID=UPI00158A7ACE|nr:ATP synthase subunit d, mitochondrial-like [Chelonus insularis]
MARRTINAINWSGIAERLAENDKPIFAAFRSKSDGFLRRMNDFPETVPAIDWEYYRKNVTLPGLVDNFQKQYESLKIPYPEDKYTSHVEEQEKIAMKAVQDYLAESDKQIAKCQVAIDKINNLLPFDQMTMEDAVEMFDIFNPDKPTIWPHDPELQPTSDEPEPIPRAHH